MAPLDWDRLMKSDPGELEDEEADEWYQVLGDVRASLLLICKIFRRNTC